VQGKRRSHFATWLNLLDGRDAESGGDWGLIEPQDVEPTSDGDVAVTALLRRSNEPGGVQLGDSFYFSIASLRKRPAYPASPRFRAGIEEEAGASPAAKGYSAFASIAFVRMPFIKILLRVEVRRYVSLGGHTALPPPNAKF